jgi:hypothetical protein
MSTGRSSDAAADADADGDERAADGDADPHLGRGPPPVGRDRQRRRPTHHRYEQQERSDDGERVGEPRRPRAEPPDVARHDRELLAALELLGQ